MTLKFCHFFKDFTRFSRTVLNTTVKETLRQLQIIAGIQDLPICVIDVSLVIDHLTQCCVHKALFIKQVANHSHCF